MHPFPIFRRLAPFCSTQRPRRAAHPAVALLLALGVTAAWAGTLSQDPLTSRIDQPAKPNVVFTIDDSGSMQVHYMPEGVSTVNGVTVTFPSNIAGNFYMTDGFPGDPTHEGGWTSAATVSALKTADAPVYQMQFRSPDINTIYYNPDVTYLPWVQSTNVRYAASTPTAAKWEPTRNETFDLTTAKSYGTNEYYWASGPSTRSASFGQTCTGSGWGQVCTVAFNPGLVYRLTAGANPTLAASYTRYDINSTGADYAPATKHANRTDCGTATKCTQAQERQNFANWFTYYRTRLMLTKGSVAEVLNATGNSVRVGMASINTGVTSLAQTVDGQVHNVMRLGVRDLTNSHRDTLLTDVRTMKANGGTPLKYAVKQVGSDYFMRSNDGNPWRDDPSSTSNKKETQCRRSFNILMTDGYYNQDELVAGYLPGNVDNSNGPSNYVPDPALKITEAYGYKPVRPYLDSAENTLADYAMYFYVNDLRTNLVNRISPSKDRTKAPYWQHLTQFTVGLGVRGTLDSRSTPLDSNGRSPKQQTLEKITAGTLSWPASITSDPQRIDDLWHAAVDTGGDFFSASNAPELTSALSNALGRADGSSRSEGGVGASSAALVTGALKFVPTYKSGAWYGDLAAYTLSLSDGKYSFGTTPKWEASKMVPAAAARKLYTWDGSTGDEFDTSMSATLKGLVTSTTATQNDLINYLRGDKTNEGDVSPKFRRRDGKLPDFVNSTPTYVKGLIDEGYTALGGTEGTTYTAFVNRKNARPGVVYIGSNGGFVHGFSQFDGAEVFGFAPKSVLANMKALAALDYGTAANFHRFLVDGPQVEADAYVPARVGGATGWKNLLIGTLGAGGQAIYGLDVTDPTQLGANSIQWEFSSTDNANIGNILVAPEVGRVGGRWMAFFGNGAHSSAGKAVLMAVDLNDRTLKQFELESGLGNNGLMGVRLLRNDKMEVLAAYAGDLQGDLWRIDFQGSADPTNWRKGFNAPLYVAKNANNARQPITVKPAFVPHTEGGGYVVLFGTGKLFDVDDTDSTGGVQTFYGVWDKTLAGQSAAGSSASAWQGLANQRSQLVAQTIEKDTTPRTDGATYYNVSANTVNWTDKRGWYMDLSIATGQRVVYPPIVARDFVLVQTMVPAGTPAVCDSSSGRGYDFLLPAMTGAQNPTPVWDTNGDGKVDDKDLTSAGYETASDGVNAFLPPPDPNSNDCLSVGSDDQKLCKLNSGTLKIRDRVWRQIVNPPQPAAK